MPSFKAFANFQKNLQDASATGPKAAAAAAPGAAGTNGAAAGAAPAAEAPPKSEEPLKIGMKVKVCGLQARPELNGLEGVLTFFDEQRSRWQVELKDGGGAKLFKAANLEQHITDDDALEILKGRKTGPAGAGPRPGSMGAPGSEAPAAGQEPEAREPRSSPDAGSGKITSDGPSPAAVAAAQVLAGRGGKAGPPAAKAEGGGAPPGEEEDDDEAFVSSIEQCLKECDVMWDDY